MAMVKIKLIIFLRPAKVMMVMVKMMIIVMIRMLMAIVKMMIMRISQASEGAQRLRVEAGPRLHLVSLLFFLNFLTWSVFSFS